MQLGASCVLCCLEMMRISDVVWKIWMKNRNIGCWWYSFGIVLEKQMTSVCFLFSTIFCVLSQKVVWRAEFWSEFSCHCDLNSWSSWLQLFSEPIYSRDLTKTLLLLLHHVLSKLKLTPPTRMSKTIIEV